MKFSHRAVKLSGPEAFRLAAKYVETFKPGDEISFEDAVQMYGVFRLAASYSEHYGSHMHHLLLELGAVLGPEFYRRVE